MGLLIKNIKLLGLYFNIFILAACTGNVPSPDPENAKDIVNVNKRLNQQAEQIEQIEQKLISCQTIIDNHPRMNDEIGQLKYELNNELKTILEKLSIDSIEQDYLNILNRVQKKIHIL